MSRKQPETPEDLWAAILAPEAGFVPDPLDDYDMTARRLFDQRAAEGKPITLRQANGILKERLARGLVDVREAWLSRQVKVNVYRPKGLPPPVKK